MIAKKIAISKRPLSKAEQHKGLLYPRHRRPKTREECCLVPRPCPFVGCRHNLYLDQSEKGKLYINRPGVSPLFASHSCALDIAEEGPQTLEKVSTLLNLTMERVRQIEIDTIARVRMQHPDEVQGVPIPPAKPTAKMAPLTINRVIMHPECKTAIKACLDGELTFAAMYNKIVKLLQQPVSTTMIKKFIEGIKERRKATETQND